ncbi:MAG: LON peptidase substrate-binding domain-containing protein, partial [Desulfobacterales bacterium]
MSANDLKNRPESTESDVTLEVTTPKDSTAILPLRDMVVFPLITLPIMVSAKSARLVEDALKADRVIGLLTVKDHEAEEPQPEDLYETGTLCKVLHANKNEDGSYLVLVRGLSRFRIDDWLEESHYLRAKVLQAPEIVETGIEIEALQQYLHETVDAVFKLIPKMPADVIATIGQIDDPLQLAYGVASNMKLDLAARQYLLEADSAQQKLRDVLTRLLKEKDRLDIKKKIQSDVHEEMSSAQRKHFLRQQLKAIQKELGEDEESASEADEYAERIEKTPMPDEPREEAIRELERLRHMSPQSAEYPLIKTYLDWLLDLPWDTRKETNHDIAHARTVLDEDHYGLKDVKERLIEFIAVRNLMAERGVSSADDGQTRAMGVILCLSGPPGVGKTSLGRSVARALGREFTRMSLGGVRDEAEIRGHRRTYVGAMPGRIIQAIKRAGSRNPVFMLDEIDKLGQGWRGDPSSA